MTLHRVVRHVRGSPCLPTVSLLPRPPDHAVPKIFIFLPLLLEFVSNVSLYLSVADLNVGVELEGAAGLQVQLVNAPVLKISPHDHGTGCGKVRASNLKRQTNLCLRLECGICPTCTSPGLRQSFLGSRHRIQT